MQQGVLLWIALAMGCGGSIAAPGPVIPPATDLACATDKDCVIEGYTDGDCCGALCEATEVMTTKRQKALQLWREGNCAKDVDCPVADCDVPTFDYAAACKKGTCVVVKTPWPAPK